MNIFSEGATIWARKTIESDIFHKKPHGWFKVWFIIVTKANHKDTKEFKRGQCFLKYSWIQDWGGLTATEIDHCIRFLKSAKQIATQKATRGFIVTVLNYDLYQNLSTYKSDTKSETESDLKAKQKRNRSDTIYNNDIYDNNEKNILPKGNSVNEIISLFKEVNPFYELLFKNTTQRKSVERLIKKYGWEWVEKLIKKLPEIISQPYAPRITTPYELETKLGQLKVFLQQEKLKATKVGSVKV
jgi:hypothetical protein